MKLSQPGDRAAMTSKDLNRIHDLLRQCTYGERRELLRLLRQEFPIHALESKLNVSAEVILEAIDRSSDLTLRGVRGVIAEAVFKEQIVSPLVAQGWKDLPITGNPAFDFLVETPTGAQARIQVKMQRLKDKLPMPACQANKKLFGMASDMWVVETQRTRGGKDPAGNATRPYRFGEFDIIAVSLHPSTNDWSKFRYTVANWLIPDPQDAGMIFKFQPVPKSANDDWADQLETCMNWFLSQTQKTIRGRG